MSYPTLDMFGAKFPSIRRQSNPPIKTLASSSAVSNSTTGAACMFCRSGRGIKSPKRPLGTEIITGSEECSLAVECELVAIFVCHEVHALSSHDLG